MKKKSIFSLLTAVCLSLSMMPSSLIYAETENNTSDFMYDDVNGDKSADLTDLSLISIYLMGGIKLSDIQKKAADVDGNGENDILFVVILSADIETCTKVNEIGF